MQKRQTLKIVIKYCLKVITLSLFLALVALLIYGYYIEKPGVEKAAMANSQQVKINIEEYLIKQLAEDKKKALAAAANDLNNEINTVSPESFVEKADSSSKISPETLNDTKLKSNALNNPQNNHSNLNEVNDDVKKTIDPVDISSIKTADNAFQTPNQHNLNEVEKTEPKDKHYLADSNSKNNAITTATTDSTIAGQKNKIASLEGNTSYKTQKAKIAILLTNLGLGKNITEIAASLPKKISLGFSSYTNSHKNLIYRAKDLGHEIFLEIPFESEKYPLDDVGPLGIITSLDKGENINRLQNILSMFPGVNGVYSLPNEKFTENIQLTEPILDILARSRLLLIYGKNNTLLLSQLVDQKKIPVLGCDIYIDLSTEYSLLIKEFQQLEEMSKNKGKAIAFISSYPITINALSEWIRNLNDKEIEIVPISEILNQ